MSPLNLDHLEKRMLSEALLESNADIRTYFHFHPLNNNKFLYFNLMSLKNEIFINCE